MKYYMKIKITPKLRTENYWSNIDTFQILEQVVPEKILRWNKSININTARKPDSVEFEIHINDYLDVFISNHLDNFFSNSVIKVNVIKPGTKITIWLLGVLNREYPKQYSNQIEIPTHLIGIILKVLKQFFKKNKECFTLLTTEEVSNDPTVFYIRED